MPYNPTTHHRRSIRLKDYDYSQAGMYFVTICARVGAYHIRPDIFGKTENGAMILNEYGQIAMQCWLKIPQHFLHTILHEYVIMPNHIHGIIEISQNVGAKNIVGNVGTKNIVDNVGAKNFSPLRIADNNPRGTSRTVGSIVRGFKIGVTKQIGYSVWQRNYHEHIIRNKESYQYIANYIVNNPINWEKDEFYTA